MQAFLKSDICLLGAVETKVYGLREFKTTKRFARKGINSGWYESQRSVRLMSKSPPLERKSGCTEG